MGGWLLGGRVERTMTKTVLAPPVRMVGTTRSAILPSRRWTGGSLLAGERFLTRAGREVGRAMGSPDHACLPQLAILSRLAGLLKSFSQHARSRAKPATNTRVNSFSNGLHDAAKLAMPQGGGQQLQSPPWHALDVDCEHTTLLDSGDQLSYAL